MDNTELIKRIFTFDDERDTSTGYNSVLGSGVNDLMSVWKSVCQPIYKLNRKGLTPNIEQTSEGCYTIEADEHDPTNLGFKQMDYYDAQLNADILAGCIPDDATIDDYRLIIISRDIVLYGKADNIEKVSRHITTTKIQTFNFFVRPSDRIPEHMFLWPDDTDNSDYVTTPLNSEFGGIVIDISEMSDRTINIDLNGMLWLPWFTVFNINIYDDSDIDERTIDFKYIKHNGHTIGKCVGKQNTWLYLDLNKSINLRYRGCEPGKSISKPKKWNVSLEVDTDLLSRDVMETVINCLPPQIPGTFKATYFPNASRIESFINFDEVFSLKPGTYKMF